MLGRRIRFRTNEQPPCHSHAAYKAAETAFQMMDADGDGVSDLVTVNPGEGDAKGPQVSIWYGREGAFDEADRWTVRMGRVRTLPVMLGQWPAE